MNFRVRTFVKSAVMVGNVGLWRAETFRWRRVTEDLKMGGPIEMPTTSKTDKNEGTIASVSEFNFHFTIFVPLAKFRIKNIKSLKII